MAILHEIGLFCQKKIQSALAFLSCRLTLCFQLRADDEPQQPPCETADPRLSPNSAPNGDDSQHWMVKAGSRPRGCCRENELRDENNRTQWLSPNCTNLSCSFAPGDGLRPIDLREQPLKHTLFGWQLTNFFCRN